MERLGGASESKEKRESATTVPPLLHSLPVPTMRRAATQLAHRASARFVPATTSTSAWVPVTEGTGSPGQRWGMGDESGGGAFAASALGGGRPPHPRLAGGHTFASSSSFATATAATAKESGATTIGPPPDVETVNALFIEVRRESSKKRDDIVSVPPSPRQRPPSARPRAHAPLDLS